MHSQLYLALMQNQHIEQPEIALSIKHALHNERQTDMNDFRHANEHKAGS